MRNDRINARELLVRRSVLRKQRNAILHHFARDGPTDGKLARMRLELVIAGAHGNRRQVCILGAVCFSQQRHYAIRRS